MKKILLFKEHCDEISYRSIDNEYKSKHYEDLDSFPLFWENKNNEIIIYIGEESLAHLDIEQEFEYDKKELPKNRGRIFLDEKILTFWDYPDEKEFKSFIKKLEDELNIKMWNNNWRIEVFKDNYPNMEGEEEFAYNDYTTLRPHIGNRKLIPIEKYKGESYDSTEDYKYHLMNVRNPKKLRNIKGFGSLSTKGKQPLKWKQAKLKSESNDIS